MRPSSSPCSCGWGIRTMTRLPKATTRQIRRADHGSTVLPRAFCSTRWTQGTGVTDHTRATTSASAGRAGLRAGLAPPGFRGPGGSVPTRGGHRTARKAPHLSPGSPAQGASPAHPAPLAPDDQPRRLLQHRCRLRATPHRGQGARTFRYNCPDGAGGVRRRLAGGQAIWRRPLDISAQMMKMSTAITTIDQIG